MTEHEKAVVAEIKQALKTYQETGARELPSVAGPKSRGVPRSFLNAVDDLVASITEATKK